MADLEFVWGFMCGDEVWKNYKIEEEVMQAAILKYETNPEIVELLKLMKKEHSALVRR